MKTIEEQFQKLGVVPVVVLEDKKDAIPLARLCLRVDFHVRK